MFQNADFDRIVGDIAGSIYTNINAQFPHPPLMLVPAITFKVRHVLAKIENMAQLSNDQKITLAKDIQISLVPMLFSYEIDAETVEKVVPTIESAALKALMKNENKRGVL